MVQSSTSSWFRGIKGRLLGAAVIPVVGFAILFGVALSGLNKEDVIIKTAHESLVPNIDAIGAMRNSRNRFNFQSVYAILTFENTAERATHVKAAQTGIADYEAAYEKYLTAPFLPGEEKMHSEAKAAIGETIRLMKEMMTLLESGDATKAKQARELFDGKYSETSEVANKFTHAVNKLYKDTAADQAKEAKSTRSEVITFVVLVASTISLITFCLLIWLAQRISTSVGSVSSRLTGAAVEVAASVEQLSQAGNSLSSSATEAAASLEQTVASLEEITSMVQKNTDSSKQVAELSTESRSVAEKGQAAVGEMIGAMEEINASNSNIIGHIEESNQQLSEIVRVVTEIGEKTKVINDIVFQTKLLSFNASVEAARAGEHGKGFAVVAEEIGNLASMSGRAAKEISEMLVESETKVTSIVDGTRAKVTVLADESKEKVRFGTTVAGQCSEILGEINGNITKLSEMANSISVASSEQYIGIQEISKAMNQLDQAGQLNAASATEVATATEGISRLAVTAQNLTLELDTVITGSASEPQTQARAARFETQSTSKLGATPSASLFDKPKSKVRHAA